MATKFLDKTGLSYFWSKIKAWVLATFAPIVHNQASNTINVMTGYSKPNSGSAIAASDSLNSAVGKLEAKVDSITVPTIPNLSKTISGSGNAITDITVSGHAITATKGSTFLTSHQSLANYVTLNSAQTISAVKTFMAKPVLNQVGLDMTVKDTTEGSTTTRTSQVLHANSSNTQYGINFALCSGGNAVIGGGEAGTAQLNALAGNSGEDLYLVADGNIYLKPNGNTWANAKTITLNNAAELSGLAKVTSTSFVGDLTGNATTVSGTAGTSLLAWNTENTVYTVGGHAIKVKLPANPNTDTHWTSHLYAGASNGNANAATTNGNTYLIICDNTTARDRRLIKGTGATTVTSDANGVITIHSTDNNTVYTHPTTSGNKHIPSGGKSGQILRWSADGTATWGADNNTTYSVSTTGSGNAVTSVSLSGTAITATKGATFLTGHQSLANVANINLSNLSSTGKGVITSLSIPSRKTSISIPKTDTQLTAPGNGAYAMEITSTNWDFCYIVLVNETSGLRTSVSETGTNSAGLHCFVPAKKGEKVRIIYSSNSNYRNLYFIYNI